MFRSLINRPATRSLLVGASILIGIVACRLLIETPNFQPVMALATLGGMLLAPVWLPMLVVGVAMLISDCFLGFYSWPILVSVYLAQGLPVLAGPVLRSLRSRRLALTSAAIGTSILSAVMFFLITNAAFWWFSAMYPPDLSGLMTSFTMGLPFFKWSLVSNMLFTGGLFAAVVLLDGAREGRRARVTSGMASSTETPTRIIR